MCNRGGHNSKSVCMSAVSCAFFISVTVSQCRSVAEGVRGGAGGLQSTAGQGTSAYCRLRGVYSKKSTVKSTVGQGGSKGVYSREVYSSLGNSLYCRL